MLFLVYTAGLMFVLRFFFGGVAHRSSPFGVLTVCSILCAVGLYWLGGLQPGTSPLVAFVAATLRDRQELLLADDARRHV